VANTGWVIIFGRANNLSISPSHPAQLSLLTGREMSTGQNAVILCGWGVKAGWLIPCVEKRVGIAGKTVRALGNMCQPERFRDEYRAHYKVIYKCPVYLLAYDTTRCSNECITYAKNTSLA